MTKATDKNSTSASNPLTTTPLFATNYKVYINHTDAGGIVYHANHLVFFENCRRDWFTELGLNGYFLETNDGQIQHFVVTQADLQYKRAILLDEVINVRIDNVEIKPASIVFYQSIYRQHSQENTAEADTTDNVKAVLLSSTKIVVACVQNQITPDAIDNDGSHKTNINTAPMRPIRVPNKLRVAIEQAISAANK